jgi:hypothetical protein
LISARFQIGKKGKKAELTGRSPLKRQSFALECCAIEEEEEEEEEEEAAVHFGSGWVDR